MQKGDLEFYIKINQFQLKIKAVCKNIEFVSKIKYEANMIFGFPINVTPKGLQKLEIVIFQAG